MNPKIRIVVLALLALGIAAVVWIRSAGQGDPAGTIRASGTVEATEVDLGFQAPGRIEALAVREGDDVVEGDTLGTLEAREIRAAIGAARAQLAAAEARLAELRAGGRPEEIAQARAAVASAAGRAEEAERDAERAARLFDGGAVSAQALERARTARDVADAALEQARQALALVTQGARPEAVRAQEAMVEQARANVSGAEAALENAVIVAPISGRVSARHREPGESVPAGLPVVTLLDLDDRWVRIYVPEDRIGAVSVGLPAHISIDTYPGRAFDGEVVLVGDEAEFTPRNVQTPEERTRLVYRVRVRVTGDPDLVLKPGMPADVALGVPPGTGIDE